MANTPEVTVGAPDDLGWRKVTIDGKSAGKVRSLRELEILLRHAGSDVGHDIHWVGGDDAFWPDRVVHRRAVGGLMFVGFLLPACLLIKIGWADSRDALTFGGRIAGYTILAADLVTRARQHRDPEQTVYAARDRYMADAVGTILEDPSARIALWAHNGHITKSRHGGEVPALGQHPLTVRRRLLRTRPAVRQGFLPRPPYMARPMVSSPSRRRRQ
ncbi:erythromycin esterase family protein [Streptomyces sp. NPDC059979]|uniref:erythromycin esterase family protein n=1 Tax=Streptomyces sp. NPDC059979 TaxID=3347021 RepID=UPI00368C2508